MPAKEGRTNKVIAFDDYQVEAINNIQQSLGRGTFTMIVREAVDYYLEHEGYKNLDIYGKQSDDG